MPDQDSVEIPELRNTAEKAPGILPKNAQTWVIVIVSGVMVVVIAFSNTGTPAAKPKSVTASQANPAPANQRQIEQYKALVDEEARKLAAERQRVEKAKGEAQTAAANVQMAGVPAQPSPYVNPYAPQYAPPQPAAPLHEQSPEEIQRIAAETERKKREYSSLFSSNLALSMRKDETAAKPEAETRAERPAARQESPAAKPGISQKTYKLFEGTVIETVLTNRLTGSFSGPVNAMVTTDVYSHDHQQLLIPKGSRVLGDVERVNNLGQQRLAVSFHRLIMPDGYSVSLDQFQGLNQIGETGLRDQVNHHYAQIFGVSLAVGAIAGIEQAGASYGYSSSGVDAYRQGVSQSLSQSALRILDRYLNVLPTFVIREGQRIKVYLTDDLQLPAYADHRLPGDI